MDFFVAALEKSQSMPYPGPRRKQLLSLDAKALMASFGGIAESALPDGKEVLPKTALPSLLFAGEADPYCAAVKASAALMPQATFFSLPGLDHNQAFMRQDMVLPHVISFLGPLTPNGPIDGAAGR